MLVFHNVELRRELLKKDVAAFPMIGVGIALQDERFFGHLVNRLDQLRIAFIAGPIDPPRHRPQ